MTRKILLAGFIFLLLQTIAYTQPAEFQVVKMDNGLTIILQEDHAVELVGVDVWVKAGSAMESADVNGISHMIEHLVFGSTKKFKQGEMDLEMESLGATLDAHTSRDWAHFSTTVSSRYLPKALDIMADMVTGAQFDQKELDRERLIVTDEIIKKQTKPFDVCKDYLAKELYGSHPYSQPIEGIEETVAKITQQQIVDHYQSLYTAPNMAVVLVGDIDSPQAISEIGRAFQALPKTPAPNQTPIEVSSPDAQIYKTFKAPYKYDYLAIAFMGPSADNFADVCTMDVLMTYIGYGRWNWMQDELSKKMKLADETSADFLTQKYPSMISLVAATTDVNTTSAKNAIFTKIDEIRQQGISAGNLVMAQREVLGDYAFQNETYGGRANTAGFYFAVSDVQFAGKYIDGVQAVTNDDIIRVARKYLDPAQAVVIVLGPDGGGTND
ncbi:insulinase family protein [bacterium]|nr:insulinase family protein [bacterium]